jgi:hypothetical protein
VEVLDMSATGMTREELTPEIIDGMYREVEVRTPWRGRARYLVGSVRRLVNLGLMTEREARRVLGRLARYCG